MEYFSTKNTNFDSLIYEITTNAKNVETENQSHFLSSMSYFIIWKIFYFQNNFKNWKNRDFCSISGALEHGSTITAVRSIDAVVNCLVGAKILRSLAPGGGQFQATFRSSCLPTITYGNITRVSSIILYVSDQNHLWIESKI